MTTQLIMTDDIPGPITLTVPEGVTMYGTFSLANQNTYPNWYDVSPGSVALFQSDGPHELTFVWGNVYAGQAVVYDGGILWGNDAVLYPVGVDNVMLTFNGWSGDDNLVALLNPTGHELLFSFAPNPVAAPELSTLAMMTIGLFLMAAIMVRRKAVVRL